MQIGEHEHLKWIKICFFFDHPLRKIAQPWLPETEHPTRFHRDSKGFSRRLADSLDGLKRFGIRGRIQLNQS